MVNKNLRSEELNEYSFPWGTVLFAMGASGFLGAAVWDGLVAGRLWTHLVEEGLVWFAIAVYWLHRTVRDEKRRWKQRLVREEDLIAAAEISLKSRTPRPAP